MYFLFGYVLIYHKAYSYISLDPEFSWHNSSLFYYYYEFVQNKLRIKQLGLGCYGAVKLYTKY